jgi:hypothetical protein
VRPRCNTRTEKACHENTHPSRTNNGTSVQNDLLGTISSPRAPRVYITPAPIEQYAMSATHMSMNTTQPVSRPPPSPASVPLKHAAVCFQMKLYLALSSRSVNIGYASETALSGQTIVNIVDLAFANKSEPPVATMTTPFGISVHVTFADSPMLLLVKKLVLDDVVWHAAAPLQFNANAIGHTGWQNWK